MDGILERTLHLIGLEKLAIKVFITSFKLGPSKIPDIAKAAKVKRSTTYLLVKDLVEKGLLTEEYGKYANKVQAINPEELLSRLSSKQRQLRRQELEFEENLQSIQSFYQVSEIKPKVRMYQGNGGLLSVWRDILSTKDEICLWTNQQTENMFFGQENHDKFIKERLSKKIKIQVLATDSKESRQLKRLDDNFLRETKILPSKTKFSAETYIYDSKVAMLDYNKDIIGIIIDSKPFSQFHKEIFNQTWGSLD